MNSLLGSKPLTIDPNFDKKFEIMDTVSKRQTLPKAEPFNYLPIQTKDSKSFFRTSHSR